MTRNERIQGELKLIEPRYAPVEVGDRLEWLFIGDFPLAKGWNRETTWVLVLLPPGYPTTPPDNFYTHPDLRLANGGRPSNTSAGQRQAGRSCLMFSYHVEAGDWKPHAEIDQGHNLLTFLDGVAKRLSEVN